MPFNGIFLLYPNFVTQPALEFVRHAITLTPNNSSPPGMLVPSKNLQISTYVYHRVAFVVPDGLLPLEETICYIGLGYCLSAKTTVAETKSGVRVVQLSNAKITMKSSTRRQNVVEDNFPIKCSATKSITDQLTTYLIRGTHDQAMTSESTTTTTNTSQPTTTLEEEHELFTICLPPNWDGAQDFKVFVTPVCDSRTQSFLVSFNVYRGEDKIESKQKTICSTPIFVCITSQRDSIDISQFKVDIATGSQKVYINLQRKQRFRKIPTATSISQMEEFRSQFVPTPSDDTPSKTITELIDNWGKELDQIPFLKEAIFQHYMGKQRHIRNDWKDFLLTVENDVERKRNPGFKAAEEPARTKYLMQETYDSLLKRVDDTTH
mmetsp:Transcript_14261/g.21340  ORF Transcript_14261/g.21340 Transcript_14261/m.21340 type:complete len:378 (+) Transcript_14261:436-1569(+)